MIDNKEFEYDEEASDAEPMTHWYNPLNVPQRVTYQVGAGVFQTVKFPPKKVVKLHRKYNRAIRIKDDNGQIVGGGAPLMQTLDEARGDADYDLHDALNAPKIAEALELKKLAESMEAERMDAAARAEKALRAEAISKAKAEREATKQTRK